jgi:hypothetical protein
MADTNAVLEIAQNAPAATSWLSVHWPAISLGAAWLMRELPTFFDWAQRITNEGGLIPIVKAFLFGKPKQAIAPQPQKPT